MNKIFGCLVIAGTVSALLSPVNGAERWIHVRVDDAGDGDARVDIQVPVSLVSTLLPALKGQHAGHAIHVDGEPIDKAELRRYWNAVRGAKDGDYVKVRESGSDVRIAKSDGFLRLVVNDDGGASRIRMTIPVPLVDAVLAGSGDKLDVDSIGEALEKAPLGDLLTVDEKDSHVRVWIDLQAAPAREDGQ